MADDKNLRDHLKKLLDSGDGHVGFDRAVKGIPPRLRGVVPDRLEHSAWQLVEHIRLAQADILEFCVNPKYKEQKWPDDYWPRDAQPKNAAAWTASIAAYHKDLGALQRLAANRAMDLFAAIPHGDGQTYLREVLLVADHTAYHVGQLILVRRALGIWGGA